VATRRPSDRQAQRALIEAQRAARRAARPKPKLVYPTSPVKPKRHRRTQAELAEIDDAIYEIAHEERPVTVRGVFYRVMSRGLVPKSEKGYDVVQRRALVMRRSGDLPYQWITDGSRLRLAPETYSSAREALSDTARFYRQQLWADQDVHVEVWSEKDAIRGVIHPITDEYDVPLMIARGFSSETFLHATAEEINREGKPAIIYNLGDHDPSGVCAWEVIERRLREFADADIDLTFDRIAVTPEQIVELDLPTRPTKKTTHAKKFVGESVEVDAIETPTLRALVREAIETHIDQDALALTRVAEESERETLLRMVDGWDESA
jgi:hypothetical protein